MGRSPEAGYSEPGSVTFQARGKSVAGYPALHGERFSAAIAAPAGRSDGTSWASRCSSPSATGDVHRNWANDLKVDYKDPASPVVGSDGERNRS